MAIGLVSHTSVRQISTNTSTTASIDTTGASLLVANLSGFQGIGIVADSKGNTWTGLAISNPANSIENQLFYVANPTVGTGHTFTISGSKFTALCIAAFSGVATTSPFDVQGTGSSVATGTFGAVGTVTPTNPSSLIVAGVAVGVSSNTVTTVDSGFTLVENVVGNTGNSISGGLAYLIETTVVTKNPGFTWTASSVYSGSDAVFISANTTTTQTVTGKGRIQNTSTQTVTGKARITASTSQTITGKARITSTTSRTITGLARIVASTSRTLTGKARITASTVQTLLGKARLTNTSSQTVTGKARISITTNQTITGIARMIASVSKTLTGKARMAVTTTRTLTGGAAIGQTTTQPITGKARIQFVVLQTLLGRARIFHQSTTNPDRVFEALADGRGYKILSESQEFDVLTDERSYKVVE